MSKIWRVVKAIGKFLYELAFFVVMLLVGFSIVYQYIIGDGLSKPNAMMRDEIIYEIQKDDCQYYVQIAEYWPSSTDHPDVIVELRGPFRSFEALMVAVNHQVDTYEKLATSVETIMDSVLIDTQEDCYERFQQSRFQTIKMCHECAQ